MRGQSIYAGTNRDDRHRGGSAGSICRPEAKMGRKIALATLDEHQRYNIHHVCVSALIIARRKEKVNV